MTAVDALTLHVETFEEGIRRMQCTTLEYLSTLG